MQNHWVMDYETLINLFVGVFVNYKTEEKKVFIIHELRDDTDKFLEFLNSNIKNSERHISFNGLAFDSQITETILKTPGFKDHKTAVKLNLIYNKAQEIISSDTWPEYPEWKLSIPQLDVYKLNHWDNPARMSSLKWIQCSTDWPNVQDMPIPHYQPINTMDEIKVVVDYCINDVMSTKHALYLSDSRIKVRSMVRKKYGLECFSYSNTKMGSELLLKMYCDLTGKERREVKQYRTHRDAIPIHAILFPYIKFETPDFQGFYQMVKETVITSTKDGFKYSMPFRGYTFEFGAGGIHQCIQPGVYKIEDDEIIEDADVTSLYPYLSCQNGTYPAHLGPEFFKIYKEEIVDVRRNEKKKPKGERDMAIVEGFKEAANASYGNSNSKYSWLYDPQYTMQTTINGQLSIVMLAERLLVNIPGSVLLQTNTDGLTLKFKKEYKPIYDKICKQWEKETKLELEFASYKAMYIWDVNNYIAEYTDGSTKCKGRFEWEDQEKYNITHLHKNRSFHIIPKTIFNHLIKGVDPEQYVKSYKNIYHFCGFSKAKGDWELYEQCLLDGEYRERQLQRTMRYYISNRGCKLIKKHSKDRREIQVEAGKWLVTDFCKYEEKVWANYDINYKFYMDKIKQELDIIMPKNLQYSLDL